MSRIVAGSAGGRRLRTPEGDRTRPTTDRVREAMFSAVGSALGSWEGVDVLDLYAGSGALGLEALSRGARRAVLVESHRRTASLVETNARELGLDGWQVVATTVQSHLLHPPAQEEERFDLVLADPPYEVSADEVHGVLTALVEGRWLRPDALLVVERSRRSEDVRWPAGLEALRRRPYGETVLWYGRHCDTPGPQGQG